MECLQCMVLTNLVLQVESLRTVLLDFIDYIIATSTYIAIVYIAMLFKC